ncbi:hypothetical protein FAGKG844_10054 [Frankia sp. AgKG'84/4]
MRLSRTSAMTSQWSPAARRWRIPQRIHTAASSSSGSPVSSGRHRVGGANRSAPGRANRAASSRWSCESRCTTRESAASSAGTSEDPVDSASDSNGGRSDSEVTDVAVKPDGPRAPAIVTIVTPAACRRNTCRNTSPPAAPAPAPAPLSCAGAASTPAGAVERGAGAAGAGWRVVAGRAGVGFGIPTPCGTTAALYTDARALLRIRVVTESTSSQRGGQSGRNRPALASGYAVRRP